MNLLKFQELKGMLENKEVILPPEIPTSAFQVENIFSLSVMSDDVLKTFYDHPEKY